MVENNMQEIERSLSEIKEMLKAPPKKTVTEKLSAASLPLASLILGIAGLVVSANFQKHQIELQAKTQKEQIVKDFMPYFGDTSMARTTAAISILKGLGYDSLSYLMAKNIKSVQVDTGSKAKYYTLEQYPFSVAVRQPQSVGQQIWNFVLDLLTKTNVLILLGVFSVGAILKWIFD